jgi:hypothetical protein
MVGCLVVGNSLVNAELLEVRELERDAEVGRVRGGVKNRAFFDMQNTTKRKQAWSLLGLAVFGRGFFKPLVGVNRRDWALVGVTIETANLR